jgi:hypothetical protein
MVMVKQGNEFFSRGRGAPIMTRIRHMDGERRRPGFCWPELSPGVLWQEFKVEFQTWLGLYDRGPYRETRQRKLRMVARTALVLPLLGMFWLVNLASGTAGRSSSLPAHTSAAVAFRQVPHRPAYASAAVTAVTAGDPQQTYSRGAQRSYTDARNVPANNACDVAVSEHAARAASSGARAFRARVADVRASMGTDDPTPTALAVCGAGKAIAHALAGGQDTPRTSSTSSLRPDAGAVFHSNSNGEGIVKIYR